MELAITTDNLKFNMHCEEYKAIWDVEGVKIQKAFQKVLGLPFKENRINLLINEGKDGSNFAGNNCDDSMNFRYNNRCKLGTFLHELSHRIVMEYELFRKAKKIYKIIDIHEVINLFLYDVLCDLYGKVAAEFRVVYESNFEDVIYKESWNKVLKYSFKERQKILKKIIKVD